MLALKTYKPSKPVHKEIENIQELCRLCLEKAQDGVMIFKDNQDVCAAVAMRIMICVGLEIKYEQSLPNMICKACSEELERYYKFRRKCQASYQRLKHHVLASKSKHEYVQMEVPVKITVRESIEDCVSNNTTDDVKTEEKEPQIELLPQPDEQAAAEKVAEEVVEMKEVQMPVQSEVNPDISTFLSTILTELGILSQERGLLQHRGLSTFELETGDQEQLVLELVEEDDDTPLNISKDQPVQESVEADDMVIDVKPQSTDKLRHGKKSRPWCSQCGRSFSSRSALTRHARAHAGGRPHACATCGATFAQKAVLQRHALVHLEVRPHQCSVCSKSFTQRGALEAHERAHAPPHARPLALHRCIVCCKVFLYASGLSRHMLTHQGRVYECPTCDRQYKDRSSLKRHLRTVCNKGRANNDNKPDDQTAEPAADDGGS